MTQGRKSLAEVFSGWMLGSASLGFNTAQASPTDAELLIDVMREVHPGYLRYQSDNEATTAERLFRDAAGTATNDGAFYLAVSEYLATIRCEHTEAELPKALAEWRNSIPTMLPVSFKWVEGTAIVTGVATGTSGVEIGDELLAVDGHAMSSLLAEMSAHISVDGIKSQGIGALSRRKTGLTAAPVAANGVVK